MPYLVLTDIEKLYGQFRALDRLSLSVEAGEFVCFLGPSGCGKTSLLRIIAGLDRQTSGRIEINGRDCSDAPPEQRDFGIVFQSYALFPNLSVGKNIGYGLRGEDGNRVKAMLELVGLGGSEEKYPAQLSGGQQQRVALARALAPAPKLLLLDEPLSALDARVRLNLRRQIRAVHERLGLTTIMVTHDQEEALTMADRVVVMNQGRVEQQGAPLEIYARPATPFIAGFVGAMNIFPATLLPERRLRLGAMELAFDRDMAPGPVTVCWRPEDVTVGAGDLTATVEGVEFLGPYHRATLRAGDTSFAADISANLGRQLGLAVGQELRVGLPSLHVFPS